MQKTLRSLGQEDPLEKELATHPSILAWKIAWTEESGRLQSMGLQRVRHDWAAKLLQSCLTLCNPIDSSQPGFPVTGILQAGTVEWVAISFSNAWKWKVKVKPFSHFDWQWPHGLQPTRLLCPWDFPGKSTGVGCHCLLQWLSMHTQRTKELIWQTTLLTNIMFTSLAKSTINIQKWLCCLFLCPPLSVSTAHLDTLLQ